MSRLRVFEEESPPQPTLRTTDGVEIARQLDGPGVRFERWTADTPLTQDATQDGILTAYRKDVDRLMRDHGYRSVDVVRMQPDAPQRTELRAKFLKEHTHSEDEVRFFVEGSGMFYLRANGRVYEVLCERGDLVSVPAGLRHWFDMGPRPQFAAIRLFTNPEGWVASFTGSDISDRFPKFDDGDGRPADELPTRGA